jgi:ATP phosphoribosyltransferase regulatory subunit
MSQIPPPRFFPPPGTRDILPEEAAGLAEIVTCVRTTLTDRGYGEHKTPLVERDALFDAAGAPRLDHAYRFLGDAGEVLILRPDLTIPAARSVVPRLSEGDYRVCYTGTVFETGRDGHPTETLMIGADVYSQDPLVGMSTTINALCAVLDDVGISDARIGLSDSSGLPRMLTAAGVPRTVHDRILNEVRRHDFVALEQVVKSLQLDPRIEDIVYKTPLIRGDARKILEQLDGLAHVAARRLEALIETLDDTSIVERLILDLGDIAGRPVDQDGLMLNVYSARSPVALGAGGDFSSAVARLGIDHSAFGFTLDVHQLHGALVGRAINAR